MWTSLERISQQVSKYGTFWSQVHYILVFVFRLMVVVTIGSAVYGDEQSAFRCSEKIVGCENLCYNKFAKISHMRFWSFQLLAVIAPTVFFHCYATYVTGEIEKVKKTENHLRMLEEGELEKLRSSGDAVGDKDFRKLSKRKRSIGDVKIRKIFSDDKLIEVPTTNKVYLAYYCTNVVKMGMEAFFMYIGFQLFYIKNPLCIDNRGCGERNPFVRFMWMEVNGAYHCTGDGDSYLQLYCKAHLDSDGYIPCFVSRPFEKTVLFRYMNVLSCVCLLVCAIDLVVMTTRAAYRGLRPKHHSVGTPFPACVNVESFYSSGGTAAAETSSKYPPNIPSLYVPIRMPDREKRVRLSAAEKISDSASDKSFI